MRQLEREVAALSGAAAGAGVDVSTILRLAAAAASQPDLLMLQADSAGLAESEVAEKAGIGSAAAASNGMARLDGGSSGSRSGDGSGEVGGGMGESVEQV